MPNPCYSPLVRAFLEGLRRTKPVTVHREKMSRAQLMTVLTTDRRKLRDHRIIALVGLLYVAYLRPSEGLRLTREAISVDPEGMLITVSKDQTNKKGPPRKVAVQDGEGARFQVLIDGTLLRQWKVHRSSAYGTGQSFDVVKNIQN
ncbi:hypothetical protein L596_029002 [Steinernema carpocapsae]|uniref:Tyr recombinase domain-containing protein n=1 Tax=Steinernema carpocapsae TaxID=34508 RepID=A0A4U5LTB9_STECR|nr:hypothetical protein L596_029002 [Steinernema carpocapsae]